GRGSKSNTVGAYRVLAPGKPWVVAGIMGVIGGILVLSFYSVVSGWTLHYTVQSLSTRLDNEHDFGALFQSFVEHPWHPVAYLAAFLWLTHFVVVRGVESGIERFSKLMMPLLFVIIGILVVCSLSMSGAGEGLSFLFRPDFSKVTTTVVLSAMGQAFFSLSVGLGCLCTYASYFKPETRLVNAAFSVCVIDSLVAILSGLIIFPVVFSVPGVAPDAGPGLVFITLPYVFDNTFGAWPWLDYLFSGMFYLLLLLAALTSSISMHEISTAFISENYRLSRRVAATLVTLVCLVLGIACSLSFGVWSDVFLFGHTIFDFFDFVTAKFVMPLGGLLMAMFVEWHLDRKFVVAQLTNDGTVKVRLLGVLLFLIRWVAPIGVGMVFMNEMASK
ncbi:MAG: sodium-dependent transporter, partial [Bacteroidaceae bacterium]|nr:sodium-dependent transporter [Bacteroidaceae bacterium]